MARKSNIGVGGKNTSATEETTATKEYSYGTDAADHISGGGGNDVIYGYDGDDTLWGGHDNDELYGGNGNDEIVAGRGDDLVYGGDGDDIIGGGSQNDILFGEAGNDTISGGTGDDFIIGGSGDDQLEGLRGHDVFVFDALSGHDVVLDFETGTDTLDLSQWYTNYDGLTIEVGDAGTMLSYGDNSIFLQGVNDLQADDVSFGFDAGTNVYTDNFVF